MTAIAESQNFQRRKLMTAMAAIVGAEGFEAATVTAVCSRAQLSRQTFYQHFGGREECFLAVMDDAYVQSRGVIVRSFEASDSWRDGLREALASLLVLFESRPDIARIWMLESLAAGSWALQRRERRIVELTRTILTYWRPVGKIGSHSMAPFAVMGGILQAIQRHLATDASEPLIDLLGPLMGIATDPFLEPDQVALEIRRGERFAAEISAGARRPAGLTRGERVEIPPRLLDPRAHRARAALVYLAERPGASNSQIAEAIGISTHAQISEVLARLLGMGLLSKLSGKAGHPNVWTLTPYGLQITSSLREPQAAS